MRVLLLMSLGFTACRGANQEVPCSANSNCNLSAGGVCTASSSGNEWCAYPDSSCPSGFRYSATDVGDGLAGACVPDTTPIDAAIDSPILDAPPAKLVITYGGTDFERIYDLNAAGDSLIMSGLVSSDATLGTTALTYGGGLDFVIAKVTSTGDIAWVHSQNDVDQEGMVGTGVTPAGDVIVAGDFAGSVSFGGASLTSAGNFDLFLAKYAGADGHHIWSVRYGATGTEKALAMAVDAAGDAYVVGTYAATGNFGGANKTSAGGDDIFIAKYRGSDGAFLWGVNAGSAGNDAPETVAVDANGVYVSGTFRSTINLGGVDLVSAGMDDIFVAAFNPSTGAHLWSERFGSTDNDRSSHITVAGGSLYLTGGFSSPLNVGGTTLTGPGTANIYTAKYDAATGVHIWSHAFGGSGGVATPLRLMAQGTQLIATGSFTSHIKYSETFDLPSVGGEDVFVQTLSQTDGAFVDAFRVGGALDDVGYALASVNGALVVGGSFSGVSIFGTTLKTSAGKQDAFVYEP